MFKPLSLVPTLLCVLLVCFFGTANAQTDFGSVAVGATKIETITVTVPKASSFTAVSVVTWEAAGLDSTQLSGGTCATATSYSAGQTCTVDVQFAPQYAGMRMGAVTLANPASNTFATTFVQGIGTAPQMVFEPGVASAIYPTLNGNSLAPFSSVSLYAASRGLAIDGNNKLSIAGQVIDTSGTDITNYGSIEVPAGGSIATLVPTQGDPGGGMPIDSLFMPASVRIDGAGDRILNMTASPR